MAIDVVLKIAPQTVVHRLVDSLVSREKGSERLLEIEIWETLLMLVQSKDIQEKVHVNSSLLLQAVYTLQLLPRCAASRSVIVPVMY